VCAESDARVAGYKRRGWVMFLSRRAQARRTNPRALRLCLCSRTFVPSQRPGLMQTATTKQVMKKSHISRRAQLPAALPGPELTPPPR
jgi:hypothetical protein